MTVTVDTYQRRDRPDQHVRAVYFTNWANHGSAVQQVVRELGFTCYREDVKLVVRVGRRRDEVVIRPEQWVVFDPTNPRKACRVQVWGHYWFQRTYRLHIKAVAA